MISVRKNNRFQIDPRHAIAQLQKAARTKYPPQLRLMYDGVPYPCNVSSVFHPDIVRPEVVQVGLQMTESPSDAAHDFTIQFEELLHCKNTFGLQSCAYPPEHDKQVIQQLLAEEHTANSVRRAEEIFDYADIKPSDRIITFCGDGGNMYAARKKGWHHSQILHCEADPYVSMEMRLRTQSNGEPICRTVYTGGDPDSFQRRKGWIGVEEVLMCPNNLISELEKSKIAIAYLDYSTHPKKVGGHKKQFLPDEVFEAMPNLRKFAITLALRGSFGGNADHLYNEYMNVPKGFRLTKTFDSNKRVRCFVFEKPQPPSLIGKTILKKFVGFGSKKWEGIVTKQVQQSPAKYKVRWEDNSETTVTAASVRKHMTSDSRTTNLSKRRKTGASVRKQMTSDSRTTNPSKRRKISSTVSHNLSGLHGVIPNNPNNDLDEPIEVIEPWWKFTGS